MKLFIWEGGGISSGYHDDGTLVMLAETAGQAREIALSLKHAAEAQNKAWQEYRDSMIVKYRQPEDSPYSSEWWKRMTDPERAAWPERPAYPWDGTDEAIMREPDLVVELDEPRLVVFNGGGYD